MAENCILASPRNTDRATVSTSATEIATLPVANLLTDDPGAFFRSQDVDGVTITFVFPEPVSVRALWLGYHNLTTSAEYSWVAAATVGGLAAPPWQSFNQKALPERPAGFTRGCSAFWIQEGAQLYEVWQVLVMDPTNPAGHLDFGRALLEAPWQPSSNFHFGFQWVTRENLSARRVPGGTRYARSWGQWREARFTLEVDSEQEMEDEAERLDREVGGARPVLYMRDPEHAARASGDQRTGVMTQSIYAAMALTPRIGRGVRRHRREYELEEIERP